MRRFLRWLFACRIRAGEEIQEEEESAAVRSRQIAKMKMRQLAHEREIREVQGRVESLKLQIAMRRRREHS